LIIVGSLMMKSLTKLKFDKVSHATSGFLTVMVMPLTYSIAYGLIAGIGTFLIMEGTFWILSLVGIEKPTDAEPEPIALGESLAGPSKITEVDADSKHEAGKGDTDEEVGVEETANMDETAKVDMDATKE